MIDFDEKGTIVDVDTEASVPRIDVAKMTKIVDLLRTDKVWTSLIASLNALLNNRNNYSVMMSQNFAM